MRLEYTGKSHLQRAGGGQVWSWKRAEREQVPISLRNVRQHAFQACRWCGGSRRVDPGVNRAFAYHEQHRTRVANERKDTMLAPEMKRSFPRVILAGLVLCALGVPLSWSGVHPDFVIGLIALGVVVFLYGAVRLVGGMLVMLSGMALCFFAYRWGDTAPTHHRLGAMVVGLLLVGLGIWTRRALRRIDVNDPRSLKLLIDQDDPAAFIAVYRYQEARARRKFPPD